jgi:antitoxin HicB
MVHSNQPRFRVVFYRSSTGREPVREWLQGLDCEAAGKENQVREEPVRKKHLGTDFDRFLEEEGLLDHSSAVAAKRVLAFQISKAMEERNLTKAAMARAMKTSRSALDRLLDPTVPSVTLLTLERAARVLGKELQVELR